MLNKVLSIFSLNTTPPPQKSSLNTQLEPSLEQSSSLFGFIFSRFIYVFSFAVLQAYFISAYIPDAKPFTTEIYWALLPSLLLVSVFALSAPFNRYLELFFYFYANIWNTITIFQAVTFTSAFDVPSLHIMLNTTSTETSGFMTMYINTKILFILSIVWAIPLFCLQFTKKYIYNWNIKSKLTFVISCVLLLLLPIHFDGADRLINNTKISNIKPSNIDRNMRKSFWVFYATHIPKVMQLNTFISSVPENVVSKYEGPQNVIVILLESGNRNQFSLYGYPRKTTPNLDTFKDLYVYTDVLSPKPVSWTSVPLVFTFADLENPEEYKTTMPDLFKAAGFNTHSFYGFTKVNKNHLIFTLLNRSDTFNLPDETFDKGSLNKIIDILKNNKEEKNFILYTTALMHAAYNHYYPEDFEEFSDTPPYLFQGANKTYRNQYDTAVKYLDLIITDFLKEIGELENTVVLISTDHGEEVGTYSTVFGHGSPMRYPSTFEVPLMIYMTDDYKQRMPHLEFKFDRPYQNDKLIHSIIDLANLETEFFIPSYSIFNPEYKEFKRYIHEEEYHIEKAKWQKAE